MAQDTRETFCPAVLTIAGSDSGGGAGLQADLKVFHTLGCFGTSAVTCVTAQNPDEVRCVEAISADSIREQIRTVVDGFPIAAAKTGMLYSAEIIETVADVVEECALEALVVDPVMVATSGSRLLREDAVVALQERLIPKARVITPNLPEAEVLIGRSIDTLEALCAAAQEIGERFGVACALKGGHLESDSAEVVDVLYADGAVDVFSTPRVAVKETHGTGCTFSAVVAAQLAKGDSVKEAVRKAQTFVAEALAQAITVGDHTPLRV